MKAKIFALPEDLVARLKHRSDRTGYSEAELVRDSLEHSLMFELPGDPEGEWKPVSPLKKRRKIRHVGGVKRL